MKVASENVVCVFVDCDWGNKNTDLSKKYDVGGYPTVIFTDPDGNKLEEMGDDRAEGFAKQIESVGSKYRGKVNWQESWEKAAEVAKEEKKPVILVFVTEKDESKKLEEALADNLLKDLREKFVLVKSPIKKDSEEAKKFGVATSAQPVLFVVDATAEKPEEKPLKKVTGKKAAKDLKKDLEAALKAFSDK